MCWSNSCTTQNTAHRLKAKGEPTTYRTKQNIQVCGNWKDRREVTRAGQILDPEKLLRRAALELTGAQAWWKGQKFCSGLPLVLWEGLVGVLFVDHDSDLGAESIEQAQPALSFCSASAFN